MWPQTDFDEAFGGGRFGDIDVSVRRAKRARR